MSFSDIKVKRARKVGQNVNNFHPLDCEINIVSPLFLFPNRSSYLWL